MRIPPFAISVSLAALLSSALLSSCASSLGRPLTSAALAAAGVATSVLKDSGGGAIVDGIDSISGGALQVVDATARTTGVSGTADRAVSTVEKVGRQVASAFDSATDTIGSVVPGNPRIISDPLSFIPTPISDAKEKRRLMRNRRIAAASAMPMSAGVKVGVIGDQIAAGEGLSSPERDGFPRQLELYLGSGWSVESFAHPNAAVQATADFPYRNTPAFAAASEWDADILLVMLGRNDLKPWNFEDVDQLADGYLDLVNRLAAGREPGAPAPQVWLLASPPASSVSDTSAVGATSASSLIVDASSIASEGAAIRVVDLSDLLGSKASFVTADGLLSEDGHEAIGEFLADSLQAAAYAKED